MNTDKYEKMNVRVLGNEFLINVTELKALEKWQYNWGVIKYIGLFIDDKMFINDDAKKIFQNIVSNSYEFVPEIRYSVGYYPSILIDTREKEYFECLKNIKLVQLMIERANQISELIKIKSSVENEGVLSRYRELVNGIKTNYEKGLILVRLLFKNNSNNDLLTCYYRFIQKKEDFEVREEMFYHMLLCDREELDKKDFSSKRSRK